MENERDEFYKSENPDLDSSRTKNNFHTITPDRSYMDKINERISTLTLKRKVRYDATLMCSVIIGSDSKFFSTLSDWEIRQFFKEATDYFVRHYGRENIISAVVHMDETNPHMHLNLVPIFEGKLCAKELFNEVRLTQLQTNIWKEFAERWGLERGKPGSNAVHLDTAEFKSKKIKEKAKQEAEQIKREAEEVKQQADHIKQDAEQIKQKAKDFLSEVHGAVDEASNKPVPKKKNDVAEEIKQLREANAALKKENEIKGKDNAYLFNLYQEEQKKNEKAQTAIKIVVDMETAYPDEFHALREKSRAKLAQSKPSFSSNRKWDSSSK